MVLHHTLLGRGFPAVWAHGSLATGEHYHKLAKMIPNRAHYIPDLRNHGKSFRHPKFSEPDLANDFLQFFDAQKLDKADVIAHSLGGHVALRFASENPDRVRKLVLLDTGPHDMVDAYPEFALAIKAAWQHAALIDPYGKSRMDILKEIKRLVTNRELQTALAFSLAKGQNGLRWIHEFKYIKNFDENDGRQVPLPSYGKLHHPTLLLLGNDSPHTVRNPKFDQIQNACEEFFNDCTINKIENAGHLLHLEKPQEVADIIDNFLKQSEF